MLWDTALSTEYPLGRGEWCHNLATHTPRARSYHMICIYYNDISIFTFLCLLANSRSVCDHFSLSSCIPHTYDRIQHNTIQYNKSQMFVCRTWAHVCMCHHMCSSSLYSRHIWARAREGSNASFGACKAGSSNQTCWRPTLTSTCCHSLMYSCNSNRAILILILPWRAWYSWQKRSGRDRSRHRS